MPKLLVAVDGSDHAARAVDHVVRLAAAIATLEVVLVNVQPEPEFRVLALHRDEILAELRDEAEKALAPVLARLASAGVAATSRVEFGDPAQRIAHLAEAEAVDGIVMGTRGLGPVAGLVLGAVTTKVLHLVDVPVTLVK